MQLVGQAIIPAADILVRDLQVQSKFANLSFGSAAR